MAWLFRPGGPRVGAMRAPALAAGVTALGGLGAVPATGIPIFTVEARLRSPGTRRAAAVPGNPAIANAVSIDRGRYCV
jgi:hypothetical protein